MNPLFYSPVKLPGLAFLGLLLLALGVLSGMMWWNLHRFESVLSYINYSHRIQNLSTNLQQTLNRTRHKTSKIGCCKAA